MRTIQSGTTWWVLGVLILALLPLLAPYDLPFSLRVVQADHPVGQVVEKYGTSFFLPIYLLCALMLVIPSLRHRSEPLSLSASTIIVQAVVHPFAVTTLMKFIWGRTRFRHLEPDWTNYMGLLDFDPGGEGLSFPSGHVATALVLLPTVLILARFGLKRLALISLAANLAYGIFVAYGRILAGAHYLTDVTASIGLAILLTPVSVWIGERYLKLFEKPRATG